MSEVNETLSACLDGELSQEEMRFLLRRLEHDAALRATWANYQVGRDGLRKQVSVLASVGFAERVMAAIDAIDQEVSISGETPAVGKRRHWLQWSAGSAIAASVAVAALMLTQPAGHRADVANSVASSTSPANSDAAVAQVAANAPVVPQWLNANSAAQFTQKAAFGPSDDTAAYLPQNTPYQVQRGQPHRLRASATSGRYLLMVRPDGYVQPVAASVDAR
ncbi:MAG TPA: sigma-E factor negative regulatory protein [Luteibacter sp.]|jgi:sigma-E factor negative regulatory protein RseA|nr:sigma-E factor negative regulatory protein [Luteibacter sp.]